MDTALLWFRRDLRLHDNPALHQALADGCRVQPVYIWAPDEEGPGAPGLAARWWLHHSLAGLQQSLRKLGVPLLIGRGESLGQLRKWARSSGASAVYWNALPEPAAAKRDARIEAGLQRDGLRTCHFNAALWFRPDQVRTKAGAPFRKFTPFWKHCRSQLPMRKVLPAPRKLQGPQKLLKGKSLAELHLLPAAEGDRDFKNLWTPGEAAALRRLRKFSRKAVGSYGTQRDHPGVEGTARLSPHLHFGEISPVQVAAQLMPTGSAPVAGAEAFLRQLGWREFAHHLLHHYPHTVSKPLDPRFATFAWKQRPTALRRWQAGATGFPIVDAGMRELRATGWMHNRVRMICASFLTKNLLISWRSGAQWFWENLVDADLANNTLGWQWVAGCGADAAPFFRIFNPVLQSRRFDPEGRYLRRWLPELQLLPTQALHAPWESPLAPSLDYPAPMVDLAASRARALAQWRAMRVATGPSGKLRNPLI